MNELSPALAAVSFDQMRAVSALGERLVFKPSSELCGTCVLSHRGCRFGLGCVPFCYRSHRNDGLNGTWRLAP